MWPDRMMRFGCQGVFRLKQQSLAVSLSRCITRERSEHLNLKDSGKD